MALIESVDVTITNDPHIFFKPKNSKEFRWYLNSPIKIFFIKNQETIENKTVVSFERPCFTKTCDHNVVWNNYPGGKKENFIQGFQFKFVDNDLVSITFQIYNSSNELLQSIEVTDLIRRSFEYSIVRDSLRKQMINS